MGKPPAKKKNDKKRPNSSKGGGEKLARVSDPKRKALDEDMTLFVNISRELKEEGNKLFQKRDHEGAMLKYEKALKILPQNCIDVAYLRTNIAACFMQLGIAEYPRAIVECNLALEVSPKYSKALLKRARCYEGMNKLNLAFRDASNVLSMEPNNMIALEIAERVKKSMEDRAINLDDNNNVFEQSLRAKKKKKSFKVEERKTEDKLVVEESVGVTNEEEKMVFRAEKSDEKEIITRTVKLVLGDDIRWAVLPVNCKIGMVRDIALDRFPNLKGVLIKYRDEEGDLVTISTTNELRLAEALGDSCVSLRLHIVEVNPNQEPLYERTSNLNSQNPNNGKGETLCCIDEWMIQFSELFKSHVGFDSDSCLDLHDIGMKLYSEAMEETACSDEAQELFEIAAEKFREMVALALFNWGNVHMSRARKRVCLDDTSRESMVLEIKSAYEWAQNQYQNAGLRYEESIKAKPNFFEGILALGNQQFELAKLLWYFNNGRKYFQLDTDISSEVIQLYNKAEENIERGMQMWEEMEETRLNGLSKSENSKVKRKMHFYKEISADEAAEEAANMRSQICRLWGTLLYERSIMEFKLGIPAWEECLEVSVEKFELAGASKTDIAVMIKNHCYNGTGSEGLGFKIDDLVQAWYEMHDAKRWQIGSTSFRLEPLFRRQVSKLHYILENF